MSKIYNVNCILLGQSGVGKTSIIRRLLGKEFNTVMASTIGIEPNFFQQIKFENEDEDDSKISINIWDTAGQEKYHSCVKGVVRRADIIIFVRDNDQENFEFWFNFVEELIDINLTKIFYCLNKTDLMSDGEMEKFMSELKKISKMKKHHATIQCVSSKTSEGIYNLKNLLEEKSQDIVSNKIQRQKYTMKIILIGPCSTGKSSLVERIINDSFSEKILPTVSFGVKYAKVDLKNHSSINYQYYDTSGHEKLVSNWIHLLDNVDIIIFVNDKDKISVNTSIVEQRILLCEKKVICCINKSDLISDAEKKKVLNNFKLKNKTLDGQQIFLVSAKTSEGIEELKNKIKEYSLNITNKIIEKKSYQLETQSKPKNSSCC